MVLLAAAVTTKAGKAIISRQFVEMSRARVEGLLAAFPKLLGGEGKQHTFVETESVRYVYQPLEKLFALLVTTRNSNILEDLETLRLFSRLIPEYCKNMDEQDIIDNAFNLIFAFDEIIALGYRESVNLAQIRTFVEMDSHEEKVFQAVRQTQEREAKQKMKEKARELQKARQEAGRKGGSRGGAGPPPGFGFGSGMGSTAASMVVSDSMGASGEPQKPSYLATGRSGGPTKALKLGSKQKEWDTFADQLKQEGEHISSPTGSKSPTSSAKSAISSPATPQEAVCLNVEEKVTLVALRDGGLQNMEVHGLVQLRITEEQFARVKILLDTRDDKGVQIQTHPNIDKELFKLRNQVALKNPSKPFPLNSDVGVLKWRFQTQDEKFVPLSINCWVSEVGNGGCDVNIEYELEQEQLELNNVVISIPLMSGSGAPVVNECEGEYHYDSRRGILEWQLPVIDAANKSGAMEFSAQGRPNDFYPVTVNFVSKTLYCDIKVLDVVGVDDELPVKHSLSTFFLVEKYEVI
ncbi:coatomer subunit delta-like [Ornithodoros turicata]|uniref:coatomer subunit delta-like n=1 Tax=Ornithodoros turicata TaxID=34597 RepID=UPI003138FDD0